MRIRIVEGDVPGQRGDAVVIPIDGLINGRVDAQIADRQLGNVGHQFVRRYEDGELPNQIADQVAFPLPLGRAAMVELPEDVSPFRWAILVCTLSHLGDLSKPTLAAAAASAFAHALELCHSANVESVVTPLLTGGWR
jgi:O-acetyl-ADP-ribose deacetylase (regulator of RNase III)